MADLRKVVEKLRAEVQELNRATAPELASFEDRVSRRTAHCVELAGNAAADAAVVNQLVDVVQDTRDRLATVEALVRQLTDG